MTWTFIIPSVRKGSLEYAVESVLNQENPHWKAIVCGDGVCVPAFEDERILTIIAPRRGSASATRMYASKYAEPGWLCFLDDDDWIEPWYLDSMIYTARSGGDQTSEPDVVISKMDNYGSIMPFESNIIHGNVGISFAVKTDVLAENPMPPPPSEDFILLKRLELAGYKIWYTNKCGYVVRRYLSDPSFKPTA
jgi:glycosyltransferase involved in cell wall biosynthesis